MSRFRLLMMNSWPTVPLTHGARRIYENDVRPRYVSWYTLVINKNILILLLLRRIPHTTLRTMCLL